MDTVAFKTLLRTTSQRLGQLQERKDAQSQQLRRDISTFLSQGQVALARAKAVTLIQEDTMSDLLEVLEMFVGVVGTHVGELRLGAPIGLGLLDADADAEKNRRTRQVPVPALASPLIRRSSPSPALVEAAASIIHAAPSTESKELNAVRETLVQRLGPAFAQAASVARNNHVSPRVMQILSLPPPTASKMDEYLAEIAQTYGIQWTPEPQRDTLPNVIAEILRVDAGSSPIVDLPRLREICARGLPDDPPWIRPRIWRLFFGTLPVLKTTWTKESRKQRDSYYDLVRRLLTPVASLPAPTDPLSEPTDVLVARISESLSRVSPDLFTLLEIEPRGRSGKCPLDPSAPDTVYITCASNLDDRLALVKADDALETPEIRLDSDLDGSLDSVPFPSLASRRLRRPETLLSSKARTPPVHRAHLSSLIRLLYIHNYIHNSSNPAVQSPHVPWLLVPLYSALVGEIDEDEAPHAEADTFWVFEALIGEIAEMEDEQGGKVWMRKMSERIKWADGELASSLHGTGLDPVLPHYSYRWLAPLLAQTLPLSSVFPVWDVIFSRPMRTRDANPKLEHLVDVCTALLIRARTPLFRLGKPAQKVPGLWNQEHKALPPVSPLRPWELSDAFKEGVGLLTTYPIDAAGGIDRILQTASDLTLKRIEAGERAKERERENVGFGARITQRMWKGLTNQVADAGPEEEEEEAEEEEEEVEETEEHDDGNETETPAVPTLTSRLANTVWRGITNQSSMDDEMPSPPSPLSAPHSPVPADEREKENLPSDASTSSSQASLWGYAEKLKDSDTIAAFSKVSTNWRAKALDAWRVRKGSNASASSAPITPRPPSAASEVAARQIMSSGQRRGSLPGSQRECENAVLDPPRPAFFRSPRESFLPLPRRQNATAPPSPNIDSAMSRYRDSDNESSSSSLLHRAGASLASLTSLQSSHSAPKSVPRPLMLSSRDLITNKPQVHSSARSEGGTPEYRGGGVSQWGEVLLANKNRHAFKQASVSSTSSLSVTSETMSRSPHTVSGAYAHSAGTGPRSDYESDESATAMKSRRVPLNRKSVSPMALASRSPHLPWNASSPSSSSVGGRSPGPGHPLSNGSVTAEEMEMETASERGWKHIDEQEQVRSRVSGTTGTALDSPTTIGSPPIPRTPLMPAVVGPGLVRIVHINGGHAESSSISTLSEVGVGEAGAVAFPLPPPLPLESTQGRVVRKKAPPVPISIPARDDEEDEGSANESESEASVLSVERTPVGKAPVRLRSKRHLAQPASGRLRTTLECQHQPPPQQQLRLTPSPRQPSLTPDSVANESATTPKMDHYSKRSTMEESEEVLSSSRSPIVRKMSKDARLRKISTERRTRESGAEEGDDEGYDDLLSAYESEEGSRE